MTILLTAAGCERRPLEDRESNMAEVFVELNWSRSSLTPAEATVIFYDESGNSPRTLYVIGNKGTIKLPMGKYSVLAFNDKMSDYSELAFRGITKYKTIEIYATEASRPNYNRDIDQIAEETHDLLASDSRDLFEVTQSMLDQTRANRNQTKDKASTPKQAHLVMSPTDVVAATKLTVHFKNMHAVRSGSQRGTIKGFAESVTLWNRQASIKPMTHTIPFSYAEYYERSKTDGFMSEKFTTFGLSAPEVQAQPITFIFEAILRDKEQTKFSYQKDITKLVEVTVELGVKINIEIGIDATGDNPPIPIPPVTLIDDGAFKPGVGDWDEEEVIKPF